MSFPFLTIDTLTHLLATALFHPFPAILFPLTHLAISPTSFHTSIFRTYLLFYTLPVLLFHLLSRLDILLAYSSYGLYGPPRKLDWATEVVVITGGAGGLGRILAERFGRRGVSVAVLDVVRDKDENGQRDLEDMGVRWYRCDVGDREQVQNVARKIRMELGTPTILINNAAVLNCKPFLELSSAEIERTYRVNVLSHYHTIQTFLPDMLQRPTGGTIVTISSVLGQLGCAALSDYTSSKAALTALHQSLHSELRLFSPNLVPTGTTPSRIALLHVAPGQLSTPLFSHVPPPPLSAFLGPVVPAALLANRIVEEIDSGRSGDVAMPFYARWIAVMGLLPPGMKGLMRWGAGLDWAGWKGAEEVKRRAGNRKGEEQ